MSFFSKESQERLEKFKEEKNAKLEQKTEAGRRRDAAWRVMENSKDPVEKAIAKNIFYQNL